MQKLNAAPLVCGGIMAFPFSLAELAAALGLPSSSAAESFSMTMAGPPEFNGVLLTLLLMRGPLPLDYCCYPSFLQEYKYLLIII